jgi:hypothetical protein
MKVLRIISCVLLVLTAATADAGDRPGRLDSIYQQLIKHDASMFPPETWSVTDVRVIREILYQVRNSGQISHMETSVLPSDAEKVEVICHKRLGDNEIEELHLCCAVAGGRDTLVVRDAVLLRNLLGDQLYVTARSLRGTGEDRFDGDLARMTDLYLNPLRPMILLWSTQPRSAATYYALSGFGRLGNDALDLPFWFRGSMIGGLSLSHIDRPSAVRDPDFAHYRVRFGIEEPINFSVPHLSSTQLSENSLFRDRRLEGSGSAVYLQGSYAPWTNVPFLGIDTAGFIRLNAEMSVAIEDKDTFSPRLPENFYSIRNYVSLLAEVRRLGIFNLGAGLAWHDLHHFSRDKADNHASRVEPTRNNLLTSLECGIAEDGGVLQYDIKAGLHFSVTEGYGYLMVKAVLMISNIFGVEVTYFKSIRSSRVPVWHYDSYLAFAPILRINF